MSNAERDNELSDRTKRSQQAEAIITAFEEKYNFPLPKPWHDLMPYLFLNGIDENGLHRIFQTLMQVEHEAGRLEARPDKSLSFDDR
jgi:hypothetical protein